MAEVRMSAKGTLSPLALSCLTVDVVSVKCVLCGTAAGDLSNEALDAFVEYVQTVLIKESNTMDKQNATAANTKLKELGTKLSKATGEKHRADKNRTIVLNQCKNAAVEALKAETGKVPSEAAAERVARTNPEYVAACERLAKAEETASLLDMEVRTAQNDYQIAMANGQ